MNHLHPIYLGDSPTVEPQNSAVSLFPEEEKTTGRDSMFGPPRFMAPNTGSEYKSGPRSGISRNVVPTKFVAEKPTPLNFKVIKFDVTDGQTKEAGIFSGTFITYKVKTDPLGYDVRRRDSNFAFLRKILNR